MPHVPLGAVRNAAGMTLDQACSKYAELTGTQITRGALSAIENGIRRPSAEVIRNLEKTYEIPEGSIDTQYEPRGRKSAPAA